MSLNAMSPNDVPPSAELHLHLEGTLEPELIFALAERNEIAAPAADIDSLRARYEFTDLQSFLSLYYDNMAVLRTEADFADLTRGYLARARDAGVRHAEVFFDPQAHAVRGVSVGTAMAGIDDALASSQAEFGISTSLIACFVRDRGAAEAADTLTELLASGVPLLGVGLDSAEVGHPPRGFADVFARAAAEGLLKVAHAGEEGPPEYITQALDELGVSRIDHGIRCLEDDDLVHRLVQEQVPLTVCPLSNVRLRVVEELADHPLPAMLAAGLLVTVNSDDPAYFGGYVDDNYRELAVHLGLDRPMLAQLARNSFTAAMLSPARRTALHSEVDRWLTAAPATRSDQRPTDRARSE